VDSRLGQGDVMVPVSRDDDHPQLTDPDVQHLLADIAPNQHVSDLGGAFSLNLHLQAEGLVLRVHAGDVSRRRLTAQQALRVQLAACDLRVGAPIPWHGSTVIRCDRRWAELEPFIPHEMLPFAIASYPWLFRALGELHCALDGSDLVLPRPAFSTYGPPGTLLRWLRLTEDAVDADPEARAVAHQLRPMLRQLSRQWVPAGKLPIRIIHGDGKLRNIVRATTGETVYLDFGFAAMRPRVHELGYALTRMLLSLGVGDTPDAPSRFGWECVPSLIAAYEEAAGVVLTAGEWRALAPAIAATCLFQPVMVWCLPDAADAIRDDERRRLMTIAAWLLDRPDCMRA
jgi:Ser/Thr protein kinase RdoA (MazF antagonist)